MHDHDFLLWVAHHTCDLAPQRLRPGSRARTPQYTSSRTRSPQSVTKLHTFVVRAHAGTKHRCARARATRKPAPGPPQLARPAPRAIPTSSAPRGAKNRIERPPRAPAVAASGRDGNRRAEGATCAGGTRINQCTRASRCARSAQRVGSARECATCAAASGRGHFVCAAASIAGSHAARPGPDGGLQHHGAALP